MPSYLKDFHPEIANQADDAKKLHEKLDALHAKFDTLLTLLAPKPDEPKNEGSA